jgi:hypothetical protein
MPESMYNPFPLLTPSSLLAQMAPEKGKRYFVRQTFPRGLEDGLRAAFLFRGYTLEEERLAQEHLQFLTADPNSFLYDVTRKDHLEKLTTAARQPSGFKVYYVGKTKIDWKLPKSLDHKLRHYIRETHPGWRTKKGGDTVQALLYEEFGRIYLKLSFLGEEENLLLEKLENF